MECPLGGRPQIGVVGYTIPFYKRGNRGSGQTICLRSHGYVGELNLGLSTTRCQAGFPKEERVWGCYLLTLKI